MGLKKPGIYDQFEYAGHWWLPGKEENKVSGTLKFSMDGITLELIGSINGKTNWEEINNVGINNYLTLYGECEEGPVTLINGFQSNKRTGYITTSILRFNSMVIGKYIESINNFKINNCAISLTNLESWLKYHPFEYNYDDDSYGYRITSPEIFEVYVEKLNATIKSNYYITSNDTLYQGVNHEYLPEILIQTDEPRELEWFHETTFNLRNLFSILMDSPVFIESMSFEEDNHKRVQIYTIPWKNYRKVKIERFQRINFDLPKIQDYIHKMFNNWFETNVSSAHQNY